MASGFKLFKLFRFCSVFLSFINHLQIVFKNFSSRVMDSREIQGFQLMQAVSGFFNAQTFPMVKKIPKLLFSTLSTNTLCLILKHQFLAPIYSFSIRGTRSKLFKVFVKTFLKVTKNGNLDPFLLKINSRG